MISLTRGSKISSGPNLYTTDSLAPLVRDNVRERHCVGHAEAGRDAEEQRESTPRVRFRNSRWKLGELVLDVREYFLESIV